eukprot:TRINITY_DN2280_c0_g2_i2.p1 TRINITY_DN2280_c0_g2~~TRINITY_DN2280_c0_g2_i2.p1  ORF type:complete len:568 (+),score=98.28 TRINITY_DN2280_c0_g2_i2:111-1814(+)
MVRKKQSVKHEDSSTPNKSTTRRSSQISTLKDEEQTSSNSEMVGIQNRTIRKEPKNSRSSATRSSRHRKIPQENRDHHERFLSSTTTFEKEAYLCEKHGSKIEFMCKNPVCLQEMCGHCILQHAEHISNIVSIKNLVQDVLEEGRDPGLSPNRIVAEINSGLKTEITTLESVSDSMHQLIDREIQTAKDLLLNGTENMISMIEKLQTFKESAQGIITGELAVNTQSIELLKQFLIYKSKNIPIGMMKPTLMADSPNLITEMGKTISTFLKVNQNGYSLESTEFGSPKLLHWFEWGKKRLSIYNIVTNTTQMIDLDIPFKVPSFSRSIILPNSHIYLLGGEEPEYFPRKEVYVFDYTLNDRRLHPRASMPHKKFDFTLCYLDGYIYVICGKDSSSEVVENCERYNVAENTWSTITPVKKKRYAASAVGFTNKKIYLFGGRSDYNNMMVLDIEEYSTLTNTWEIIQVRGANVWNPVEVCACIQIGEDKVLIFGGSDARIKDSSSSYLFSLRDYCFEKKSDLKRSQVFVTAPFLYGKYVYAVGNEYYMKHRNLHRYSLEREEWEIIFQAK